jgi:hypothetical protein
MPVNTHVCLKGTQPRNQKLIKLVLIFLFTLSLPASAQVLRIDTIGCGIDDTAYLSRMVKYEAQFYNRVFSTHKNDTATIRIDLYGNVRTYIRALKLHKLKPLTNGMYSPEFNKAFAYKTDFVEHAILHAASNNLLSYNYPTAPRWLVEGIASVMSYIDEEDGKLIYIPLFDYNKMNKDLTWNNELDYDLFDYTFMTDNPDWNSKSKSPTLYSLSYGVIYFLIIQNKDYLTPIIASMKEGHTAAEAITSAFGDFDTFRNRFMSYYRYAARSKFQ